MSFLCLSAQQLQLDEPPYYQNTPFAYRLEFTNEEPDAAPAFADSQDVTISVQAPQTSRSQQVYIIQGKMTRNETVTTIYSCLVTPLRTGRLTIPAATVKVKGKTRTIPPQTITVREMDANGTVTLSAELDKTIAAVGEPLTLRLTLTSQASIQQYQFHMPILDGTPALDCQPAELPQSLRQSRRAVMLTVNGQRIPALQSSDSQKLILTFDLTLIPRQPGTHTLPPAAVVCEVVDAEATQTRRRSRRSPFDDDAFFSPFFGRQPVTVRCAAQTAPIDLTVVEPPADTRPASYTGLAEPCSLTVTADQTNVHVGDPIVLSITVRGPRFPQSIRLPRLAALPGFAQNFRVFDNDEPGQPAEDDTSVTFRRTIRAANADVTAIPPVSLSWFDAADKLYKTAASQPIPITVKPTQNAQPIVADQSDYLAPALDKLDVAALNHTPQGNFPVTDCLVNQAGQDTALAFLRPLALPFAIPGAATLLLALATAVRHLRSRNPKATRARNAASHALASLHNATTHQAVEHALFSFIADKLDLNADAMTPQDAEDALRNANVPENLRQQLHELLDDCEASRYAGRAENTPEQARQRAQNLINELEPLLQSPPARPTPHAASLALALLLATAALHAAPTEDTLRQAEQLYLQGLQNAKEHPEQAAQLWSQAQTLYQNALDNPAHFDNARLRHNLANVHLAQRHLGLAIFNYLAALRLEPDNPTILANLAIARAQCRDQLQPDEQSRVLKTLFAFHYDLSLTTRRTLLATAAALTLTLLALTLTAALLAPQRLRRHPTALLVTLAIPLLVALATAASLAVSLRERQQPHAVVIASAVHAKTGPSNAYQDAFQHPLHDGTECRVLQTDETQRWLLVQLPNQLQAWLPADALIR
ncbi:MAG: BatD family protein [Oligosphaeraceae bacterium]